MGGPVDDDMANLIVAQLLYLDSVSPSKDITMYVNSPGGSVTAGDLHFCLLAEGRQSPALSECVQPGCACLANSALSHFR